MSTDSLKELRQKIDAVDDQMMRLLMERAALVQQVGEVKAQTQAPVFRPEREAAILQRLGSDKRTKHPVPHTKAELFQRYAFPALPHRLGNQSTPASALSCRSHR